MARYYFGAVNPIGRYFSFLARPQEAIEIVGVARDAKYRTLLETTWRTAYIPLAQTPERAMTLHFKVDGDPSAAIAAVREKVRALDSRLPLERVRMLTDEIRMLMSPQRLIAYLSSFFGMLAIVKAAVGIYGVVAGSVARRIREIGIRMAIGAGANDVVRMILRQSTGAVAIGLLLGIPLAFGAARLISALLYGIKPTDPVAMQGSVALLLGIALVAAWLPARRAAKADPAVTLRYE